MYICIYLQNRIIYISSSINKQSINDYHVLFISSSTLSIDFRLDNTKTEPIKRYIAGVDLISQQYVLWYNKNRESTVDLITHTSYGFETAA